MADQPADQNPIDVNMEAGAPQGNGAEQPAAPPPLDPALVSRASAFNITEDDLRVLPRDTVERIMAGADKAMVDAFRRERNHFTQQPPAQPQLNGVPGEFALDPFDLAFTPEDEVGEPITKNMAAMKAWASKQLEKVHKHYESKFKGVEQFVATINRQNHFGVLDRYVDSLGPEWSGVFGKGPSLDMDSRSQEFLKRDELGTAAVEMMQMHERLTGRPLSATEALHRARNAMFFDKASAIERTKAEAKRKELADQAAVRPRSSGGATPPSSTINQRARTLVGALTRK